MFVTQGPVSPESGLFVGRKAELRKMQDWLHQVSCVGAVLGARQTGKTSMLLKLRHLVEEKHSCAFIDLQCIEGADVEQCFSYIAEEMIGQLADTITDTDLSLPKDNRTFLTFLQQFSARSRAIRIAILLDEFGALPEETGIKLAHTIRAVFTNRIIKQEYARYVFLIAGATDMLELTRGKNSPLKNVTESIYLGDLSPMETAELLAEGFSDTEIEPSPEINHHVHAWTGGHPYWTQLLGATVASLSQTPTEETISGVVEDLLRTEDKNLPHVIRGAESGAQSLWQLIESLVKGDSLGFSRSNAAIAELELIGVITNRDGRCEIRNQIYERAIQRRLASIDSLSATKTIDAPASLMSVQLLRPGVRIGQYILVRKLGAGRFGVAWLGERRTSIATTQCALKFALDPDIDVESVKKEAAVWVLASGHANILPIIEADVYDGQIVIVSEYAPDGSLYDWLERRKGKARSIEAAVEMESGILAGLDHLHSKGIIHRDLKPANILLQKETPRLADFGIAKLLQSATQSDTIKGTPCYMAPEAFDGKRNEQTDVWSAGVILYELLSGRLPFDGTDLNSLLMAVTRFDPEPLPASVPLSLQDVTARALAKYPVLRYKSAAEMRKDLHDAYHRFIATHRS